MKERPGRVGRVTGFAAGLAAAARRRQRAREPRIALYDASGHATVIAPSDERYEPLLATGRALIELGAPEPA